MANDVKQLMVQATRVVLAIADAIREAGEIPSGHLYAVLCGKLSYNDYTCAIDLLEQSKLIENRNHLLVWVGVGPKGATK